MKKLKIIILLDDSDMIEIKCVRNVILNNIDCIINLPGCIVLPPGVAKISRFEKIQWFDKSDTDISDLIIECFDRDKSCQKLYFKQLISTW